jgi:hypothetical protein
MAPTHTSICFCKDGFVAGDDPMSCHATGAPTAEPTFQPTFSPTKSPCDDGEDHGCDSATTQCETPGDGITFNCACLEGFVIDHNNEDSKSCIASDAPTAMPTLEPTTPTFMPTAPRDYDDDEEAESSGGSGSGSGGAGGAGGADGPADSVSIPASLIILDDDTDVIVSDWFKISTVAQDTTPTTFDEDAFKATVAGLVNAGVAAVSTNNMVVVVESAGSSVTVKCIVVVPAANGDDVNGIVSNANFVSSFSTALAEHGIVISDEDTTVERVLDDTGDTTFGALFGPSMAQKVDRERNVASRNSVAFVGAATGAAGVFVIAGVLVAKRSALNAAAASAAVATPAADFAADVLQPVGSETFSQACL